MRGRQSYPAMFWIWVFEQRVDFFPSVGAGQGCRQHCSSRRSQVERLQACYMMGESEKNGTEELSRYTCCPIASGRDGLEAIGKLAVIEETDQKHT